MRAGHERNRHRQSLLATAALLALLAAGPAPAAAQESGGASQGGQDSSGSGGSGGDAGSGASGTSGTTGDLGTNIGRPSTSDVEDPGGGTAGALPGTGGGGGAAPVVSLPRDRVMEMQEGLAAAGYDPGPADGVVGPRTRDALRSFQEARGLDATGEPNGDTMRELGID